MTYDIRYTSCSFCKSLDDKRGVCLQYSEIFKEFCDTCGIKCYIVIGSNVYGESHAWIKTIIDGQETYTDSTWNQTYKKNNWLLISENKTLKDHIIQYITCAFFEY
jgi:transglutaminase/protease-like cytokinesis protein 3